MRERVSREVTAYRAQVRTIRLSSGVEVRHYQVDLCPHALRKMLHAQANFLTYVRGSRKRRRHGRMLYWSRHFKKWCDILITRPLRSLGYERLQ